ncbi:hypothetical protein F383_10188 [Gossypium arboreum]|uniref:Uncharacterized protein n=1 Tax=Gossypium arboreum TaxID=29729 RepID=A0A0B0NJP5_GOSAR|nr:hypothetical protein F383_10188 [Gossypium arboreum]
MKSSVRRRVDGTFRINGLAVRVGWPPSKALSNDRRFANSPLLRATFVHGISMPTESLLVLLLMTV